MRLSDKIEKDYNNDWLKVKDVREAITELLDNWSDAPGVVDDIVDIGAEIVESVESALIVVEDIIEDTFYLLDDLFDW